jgi:hypothetical protein
MRKPNLESVRVVARSNMPEPRREKGKDRDDGGATEYMMLKHGYDP